MQLETHVLTSNTLNTDVSHIMIIATTCTNVNLDSSRAVYKTQVSGSDYHARPPSFAHKHICEVASIGEVNMIYLQF